MTRATTYCTSSACVRSKGRTEDRSHLTEWQRTKIGAPLQAYRPRFARLRRFLGRIGR
jgi:hypothetical protein